MGTQLPIPKTDRAPIFGLCLLWPNCWMDQDDNWHGRRPHCAGFWSQLPLQKKGTVVPPKVMFKGHSSQFSVHVCCGQTAGWIKMTIGMVVVLIVLDFGASSLSRKKAQLFPQRSCLLWPNGRMHQATLLDEDRAASERGTAPNFWPMSIVAKRLAGSRCLLG